MIRYPMKTGSGNVPDKKVRHFYSLVEERWEEIKITFSLGLVGY